MSAQFASKFTSKENTEQSFAYDMSDMFRGDYINYAMKTVSPKMSFVVDGLTLIDRIIKYKFIDLRKGL